MLKSHQLSTMLQLQDKMNSKVNPDWLATRSPFLRAVVIEGAEAIEHHGWKWWKKQHCDMAQLQMELVDIWHFILSEILLRNEANIELSISHTLQELQQQDVEFDGQRYLLGSLSLLDKLELLIGLAAAKRYHLGLFAALLKDCDMNWQNLFTQYVCKNVLNFFRQDHGYQLGTYNKVWHGREDNEHLVELMEEIDQQGDDFQERLYEALSERYQSLS